MYVHVYIYIPMYEVSSARGQRQAGGNGSRKNFTEMLRKDMSTSSKRVYVCMLLAYIYIYIYVYNMNESHHAIMQQRKRVYVCMS
jgi:hypothetical protein